VAPGFLLIAGFIVQLISLLLFLLIIDLFASYSAGLPVSSGL
jgi:hypothetical protein